MNDPLAIGVFPFGLAAGPGGLATGPPDDFAEIRAALRELQGSGPPLITRAYLAWTGPDSTAATLRQVADFQATGLMWDLVLAYRDRGGDIESWCRFVAEVVRRFGDGLAAVQVTGEANLTAIPGAGDGAFPRAVDALAAGVSAAAQAKHASRVSTAIGFAVVPEANPGAGTFWPALAAAAGRDFGTGVDYAGLDMYPDVFGGRVPLGAMDDTVAATLHTFRDLALPMAGIGSATPIRICETGWPTGPDRPEQRQADVLDAVLRSVHARRHQLNISQWELFALRDANSSNDNPLHQFGVLRDDYTPKPAFDRLRRTIAELTDPDRDEPSPQPDS